MSSMDSGGHESLYGFEIRVDLPGAAENPYKFPPAENYCQTRCPHPNARCGIVALILRADEQGSQYLEAFGEVVGEKDGVTVHGEAWIDSLANPMGDPVFVETAGTDDQLSPDTIFEQLGDSPEIIAAQGAAFIIGSTGCLLDAVEQAGRTPLEG